MHYYHEENISKDLSAWTREDKVEFTKKFEYLVLFTGRGMQTDSRHLNQHKSRFLIPLMRVGAHSPRGNLPVFRHRSHCRWFS